MKLLCFLFAFVCTEVMAQQVYHTDVLVIGGGTGGTAAGLQSARLGAKTIIAEPTSWLGGMISAAGVSAVDGNHQMPSGIWGEFRSRIYQVYGGPGKVETGWVSNTLFEPHVADSIFKAMAAREKNLTVKYYLRFLSLNKLGNKIQGANFLDTKRRVKVTIVAKVFIDGTELGDVLKQAGEPYDIGMESQTITGENAGVKESNNIIQDLTYVAVLKDYGIGANRTIAMPLNYDPHEFDASNTDYYKDSTRKKPNVDAKKMLDYGRLPRNKYMLNWPIYGNDTYLNVIEMPDAEREKVLEEAKQTTLRFTYFIQHTLGFKHLGLADDEFPTTDKLALMPYHREGRRLKGLVRYTMQYIEKPFEQAYPLYRTGISIGDYPIDHHHKKNPDAPQHLEFHPVPSFNVPLGALVPTVTKNLVVAEKGISVSNVVNGTTRLQPFVMLTGQAAGALAALAAGSNKSVAQVGVRNVQQTLLRSGAYLMPYIDVKVSDPAFEAIQKTGATGILRGTGIPYKWANQTWFYPDSLVNTASIAEGIKDYFPAINIPSTEFLTVGQSFDLLMRITRKRYIPCATLWNAWGLNSFELNRNITRRELSVMLNKAKIFEIEINHFGNIKKK